MKTIHFDTLKPEKKVNLSDIRKDNSKLEFNGIVHFYDKYNTQIQYLVFIKDMSDNYLKCLKINSVERIKTISNHISDILKNNGVEVPFINTEFSEDIKNLFGVMSYGMLIFESAEPILTDIIIDMKINELPFDIVKFQKIDLENNKYSVIEEYF